MHSIKALRTILLLLFGIALLALPQLLAWSGLDEREARSILAPLTLIMIWGIFALSYNVLYGVTGLLSLGHSLFLGAGALSAGLSIIQLGLGFWSALFLGAALSAALAVLLGAVLSRIRGDGFWVATAVLGLTGYQLMLYFGDLTGGASGLRLPRGALTLGSENISFTDPSTQYFFVAVIIVSVYGALRWLLQTPAGYALLLIRENEARAALLGYPVSSLKWAAFAVAGSLAGLAGALLALSQRALNADLFQWTRSIEALAWVVLGGPGTTWGPLLGTLFGKGLESLGGSLAILTPLLLGLLLIVIARLSPWERLISSRELRKTR